LAAELVAFALQLGPSAVYSADDASESFKRKGLTSNPTFRFSEETIDEAMLRCLVPFRTGERLILVQHGSDTVSRLIERWRGQIARASKASVGLIVVLPITHDHAAQEQARETAKRVLAQGGGVLMLLRADKRSLFLDPYPDWKQDEARGIFMVSAYMEIELQFPSPEILVGCDRHGLSLKAVICRDFSKAERPAEAEAYFDEARQDAAIIWLEPRISRVRDALLHIIARMYA
jgi:hypothetical protein